MAWLASSETFWAQGLDRLARMIEESVTMKVNPYLNFEGRCEEAVSFYKKALGAEVGMLMRVKDAPEAPPMPPGNEEKVLHCAFRIGESVVMGSDMGCGGTALFQGFSLSLSVPDEAAAKQRFDALADGGQVRMPLSKTFFSPAFGMVVDRFGISWMVIVEGV